MPIAEDYYDAVLDAMLGTGHSADWPTTLYAALFVADPGVDDSGVEVSTSGTNYARVAVPNSTTFWPDASGGSKTLAFDITFPTSTASWGAVQWLGFYDAVTSGTLVWSSRFTGGPQVAFPAIFTPKIVAGTLTVTYWALSGS